VSRGSVRARRLLDPSGIGLTLKNTPKPATSRSLLGNDNPLEIEIGSGKGTFLAIESKLRPEINFLGIEQALRYWRFAADRLRRKQCDNVQLILAEAYEVLCEYLPENTVDAVHVYFPDPWPKRRHHKRRLIQPSLVKAMARCMRRGARLQVLTDHAEYFVHIQQVLETSSLALARYLPPVSAQAGELVGSNFERKYRERGRPLYSIAVTKCR